MSKGLHRGFVTPTMENQTDKKKEIELKIVVRRAYVGFV